MGIFAYWYVFYDWSEYASSCFVFAAPASWGKCVSREGIFEAYSPDFTAWSMKSKQGVGEFNDDLIKAKCDYFTEGKTTASTLSLRPW